MRKIERSKDQAMPLDEPRTSKLLEKPRIGIKCNGTKRPTLCTVPYTRYLYRHIKDITKGYDVLRR